VWHDALWHDALWRSGVREAAFASDRPLDVGTAGFDRIEANGREMNSPWTVSELEAVVTPVGTYRLMGLVFEMVGARQNRTDVPQLREHLDRALPPNRHTGNGDGRLVHREGIQSIGQKHTIQLRRDQ
jgi:hypothetical protein